MDPTGVRRPGLLCRFGSKVLVEAPCWFLLKAGVVVLLENLNVPQAFRDVSWFCFPQADPPSTDPWTWLVPSLGSMTMDQGHRGDSITSSTMAGQASAGRMFWRMFTGGGHMVPLESRCCCLSGEPQRPRLLGMGGSVVQGA